MIPLFSPLIIWMNAMWKKYIKWLRSNFFLQYYNSLCNTWFCYLTHLNSQTQFILSRHSPQILPVTDVPPKTIHRGRESISTVMQVAAIVVSMEEFSSHPILSKLREQNQVLKIKSYHHLWKTNKSDLEEKFLVDMSFLVTDFELNMVKTAAATVLLFLMSMTARQWRTCMDKRLGKIDRISGKSGGWTGGEWKRGLLLLLMMRKKKKKKKRHARWICFDFLLKQY
jgi:hypothetical protein